MDNCNVHGFIPGRISDEMQHSFIKNFLQTTTLFPQGPGMHVLNLTLKYIAQFMS